MPEPLPHSPGRPTAAGRLLGHLYEVGRLIQDLDRPDELLDRVLDLALQVLGAERGMVLLREEDGALTPAAVRHLEDETVAEAAGYSHTAVREALAGRPVFALDVAADPGLADLMSVSLHDIRSLVCVPLRLPDRILGVLYLDTRRDGAAFRDDDMRFLTAFAAQAALALDSARLVGRLRRENRVLSRQARERDHFEGLLGRCHAMQQLYDLLERAAESPFPALLTGETGSGKELAARAIHARGSRRGRPFLAVNCAAFSESLLESELFGHVRGAFTGAESERKGVFELADGGVLFLDEIGGMSPGMQAKLLRVLQEGEFRRVGDKRARRTDVRILAATHMDLEDMVRQETFREDLYYRLNVIRIHVPPLRDRREDVPRLVDHFLARALPAGAPPAIPPVVMRALTDEAWPGNVRELEHAVQKLVLYAAGRAIDLDLLRRVLGRRGRRAAAPSGGFPSLREVEAHHMARALEICGGDRQEAARRLGIGRATIYRKIREYGLKVPEPPRRPGRRPRR